VAPTESDKVPFVEDFGQAASQSVKEWHEQLYNVDVGSIQHMLQLGFNYLDRKWILEGQNAGPINLAFESATENYFMVCGPPGGQQHCNATNTSWKVDGAPIGCKFKAKSVEDGACLNACLCVCVLNDRAAARLDAPHTSIHRHNHLPFVCLTQPCASRRRNSLTN